MFTMIFACDLNGAIGKDGDLPWRQSSDLQHFKRITMSKTMVMGRKTWESLPGKLPGRRHIVLSRTPRDDVEIMSFESVLELGESEELIFRTLWKMTTDFQNQYFRKRRLKKKLKFWKK